MNTIDLNDLKIELTEGGLNERLNLFRGCVSFLKELNSILFEDFSKGADIILADIFFEYLNTIDKDLIKFFNASNEDTLFYYSVFLFLKGEMNVVPLLLKYAEGEDIDRSMFVINKLVHRRVPSLIEIVSRKLEMVSFEKVDYLICLLNAQKVLNANLPSKFIDRLKNEGKNVSWQIRSILKNDFGVDI